MEQPNASLQLILPTDKRNPCFTLYQTEDGRFLHVYYGLERLEVVPAAADHPAHRMLVARLYNADVKVAVLEELFDLDHKTIRAWGLALDSGDPEALQRMLFGAPRKLTPAIREFIAGRWPQLRAQRCRNHREVLQNEIKAYFGVSLSGESLRIMMNQLSGGQAAAQAQAPAVPEVSPPADTRSAPASHGGDAVPEPDLFAPVMAPPRSADEPAPTPLSPPQIHEVVEVVPDPGFGEWTCVSPDGPGAGATPPDEPKIPDSTGFSEPSENGGEPPVPDWFESKFDPWPWQPQTVAAVLRWNFQQLGEPVMRSNDFYLDPHTKHYTGMQRVLKGWCASIRWADKVMHGDFIHTAQGHPIYFEWVDNYDDLRVRFRPLIERMRATLGLDGNHPQAPPRTLTIVVDRGIYSNELFSRHELFSLVAADPGLHLITWEKGYTPGPWDETRATTRFGVERPRNNSRDVRLYQFSVVDRPWAHNPAMRQLIVRATNAEGKVAQIAVLTDDLERSAKEIVWLIFNRWIQENDFKYIDKHMGMKQITSYKSIDYSELRDNLVDRQVPNELYVQKTEEGRRFTRRKARLLLAEDTAQRQEAARQQEVIQLEADPKPTGPTTQAPSPPDSSKRLKALRQASRRSQRYSQTRREQLDELQIELDRIETENAALDQEVSRKEQLIDQQMVRLDTANKTLMDAIKICARNLFYQALATINASDPQLPDGSGRKVELRLTDKSRITVRISDDFDVQPSST